MQGKQTLNIIGIMCSLSVIKAVVVSQLSWSQHQLDCHSLVFGLWNKPSLFTLLHKDIL